MKFHGDPSRSNCFWVYPKTIALINEKWDTHLVVNEFCSNANHVKTHENGITEHKCNGHEIGDISPFTNVQDVENLPNLTKTIYSVGMQITQRSLDKTQVTWKLMGKGLNGLLNVFMN
jgi:hypothetical protein